MREMDVNAIAGTLKLYFRELPEPLFTDELYPSFAGAIGQRRRRRRCSALSTSQLIFSALCPLQLSLIAWPKRAACSTCCYRYRNRIWSPSSFCSTTLKGQRRRRTAAALMSDKAFSAKMWQINAKTERDMIFLNITNHTDRIL